VDSRTGEVVSRQESATRQGRLAFVPILVAATFLLGSSFPTGKILLQKVPPFSLAGWRFLAASMATMAVALLLARRAQWIPTVSGSVARGVAVTIAIGLMQTGGTIGFLNLAMRTLPASMAAILLFANPIWVALLSRAVLNERLSRVRAAGLLTGLIGVALTVEVTLHADFTGIVLGFFSGVCFAASTLITKRFKPSIDSWALTSWQMLAGAVALLIVARSAGETWPTDLTWVDWGWFWWLTIPASTGSFGLWFLALQRSGATQASGFLFLAPVFAVLLAHLGLNESLTAMQGAGAILVLFAIWLLSYQKS